MSSCEHCNVNDTETERVRNLVIAGYIFDERTLSKVLSNDQIDNLACCLLHKQLGGCVLDNISAALNAMADGANSSE